MMYNMIPISQAFEIISGGTPKRSVEDYWKGNIPWVAVKDFNNDYRYILDTEEFITIEGLNNSSTNILELNDIVISARGTVGKINMIREPMAFNQSCYGLRSVEKLDPTYGYFAVKNSIRELQSQSHGSVFSTITKSTFNNVKIPVPSLLLQKSIANILSSLDDKIENNNAIIANLEKQAQAIFKSWFVDFEPFKDSQFINSSMGKIPITCKVSKLKNLSTSMFNGGTPRRNNEDYWINGKIPWLKTKEINNNFIIETEEYITDKGLNESSAKLIRDRSVVVALYGATAGELGFIGKDMTANQACCAIESDYQSYIYYYLKNNQSYIKTLATGSAQQNLSKSTLENLDVLYPEQDYLDRFEKMARSFIEKSIYLELENKKLEKTRDTLLPKLMSGEIRVEEAIEVEEM